MVQRAAITQLCRACPQRTRTEDEMAAHVEEAHGEGTPGRYPPGLFTRAEDQREFHPFLSQTPWGKELR